jgi:hypothetical protein
MKLREKDLEECARQGLTAGEAVRKSIALSSHAERFSCFGWWGYYAPVMLGQVCWVWAITTEAVDHKPLRVARASKRIFAGILERYPVAFAQVDVDHKTSQRWLEWLGFEYQSTEGRAMIYKATR